jgi:ribosome-associated protein
VTLISPEEAAILTARIAEDMKAENVLILDVRRLTTLCDFFVIGNGLSDTHTRAIVDAIVEGLPPDAEPAPPLEGYRDARWVILDCGAVIAHVFSREGREFYELERLWADAPALGGWQAEPLPAKRSSRGKST